VLSTHDPEPEIKDHYRDLAILSIGEANNQFIARMAARHLFGYTNEQVINLFNNARLVDSKIVRKGSTHCTIETGDRITTLTPDFVAKLSTEGGYREMVEVAIAELMK